MNKVFFRTLFLALVFNFNTSLFSSDPFSFTLAHPSRKQLPHNRRLQRDIDAEVRDFLNNIPEVVSDGGESSINHAPAKGACVVTSKRRSVKSDKKIVKKDVADNSTVKKVLRARLKNAPTGLWYNNDDTNRRDIMRFSSRQPLVNDWNPHRWSAMTAEQYERLCGKGQAYHRR